MEQLLQKTVLGMMELNRKLDEIIKNQKIMLEYLQGKKEDAPAPKEKYLDEDKPGLDAKALLTLPDHLRKTASAICKLGRATAEDIAKHTNREEAIESSYLNQLVTMGYLKKEKQANAIHFHL